PAGGPPQGHDRPRPAARPGGAVRPLTGRGPPRTAPGLHTGMVRFLRPGRAFRPGTVRSRRARAMTSQTHAAPAPVPATEGGWNPTVALAVRTCGLTHPGKGRENNQDHFVIAELSKLLRVLHTSLPQSPLLRAAEQGYLFIVADGMGGSLAGEQASNLTVFTLEQFILNTLHWFFRLRGPEGERVLADFQAA